MVLKTTNEILNQFTSALLVSSSSYIETIVFGLNLSSIDIKKIIKEYYELVKIGWAFFSIFPEEIVLSALFNKPEYKYLLNSSNKNNKIQIHEKYVDEDVARNYGYYFHHKDYSKYKK